MKTSSNRFFYPFLCLILACGPSVAFSADEPAPAAQLHFTPELGRTMQSHGEVKWGEPGPRPPEFPDFSGDSNSVRIGGKGSYVSFPDKEKDSPYQFNAGDAISLEGWIKVNKIQDGSINFIVSKGRTGQKEFPQDNLNWALRVVGIGEEARLNFIFATPHQGKTHWHRWTSSLGFVPSSGWHHLAVSYRFGEPYSIKGWIDGVSTDGLWDYAGATERSPVADRSDVWIGNSMRRDAMVSFDGWIHSVAIHRRMLDDRQVATRFKRNGGPLLIVPVAEPIAGITDVPENRVLVTVAESMPSHDRWPYKGEAKSKEVMRWSHDSFLLHRLPRRYDDWGIRTAWKAPLLLTMAADVPLPDGRQKLLLRARGLGRLWIDGELVARTNADVTRQQSRGGRNPITIPQPPLPGARPVGEYMQEVAVDVDLPAPVLDQDGKPKPRRVVFEQIVGAKGILTMTGETSVALLSGDGKAYHLLQAGTNPALPLTDHAVDRELAAMEASLAKFDDANRRKLAGNRDDYWQKRRDVARTWAAANPAPAVPATAKAEKTHPVDAFLYAKIDKAATGKGAADDSPEAAHFHQKVLPLLQNQCFRCHGEKDRGDLKLDSRETALLGGDSGIAAVVPGKPMESELIARILTGDESERMPPKGDGLTKEQTEDLKQWIQAGAVWPETGIDESHLTLAPVIDDTAFLRRIHFDLVGLPPTEEEILSFLADPAEDKRGQLIARLLKDERHAGHWISFWMDLLAENPSLIATSMNSTGPFRWFLYEALRDRKPLDRMVTELLMMRGTSADGGSAGFAVAGESDAPFAEKGHIVASAFLAVEMQCARCHDSPYHSTTQQDLFSMAAMLGRRTMSVPETSRVPAAFFENSSRASLIKATLKPDAKVAPVWPFAEETGLADSAALDDWLSDPKDTRERLALLITSPENQRFSKVIVNRLWKRLMGAGIIEPIHDWEGREASHPELLDWLAHEFVSSGYDVDHVTGLIVSSQAYQRESVGNNVEASAEQRYFQAPDRRRLSAEQIVDAMHVATKSRMDVEELTFDPQGRWPAGSRMNLGLPDRAWMMVDLKNERDRPSLSLPKARAVADVLEAFGWVGARQKPISERVEDVNVLQPGSLANSVLTNTLTRASAGSSLARIAIEARQPGDIVDTLFLSILNRHPSDQEKSTFSAELADGFGQRLVEPGESKPQKPLPRITWLNHANPEANTIQEEYEDRVRQGPPADPRLQSDWRARYEDVVWSLINNPEFIWLP